MFRKILGRALLPVLRVLIIVPIALKSLFFRTRMSHENGVVARGTIRIVDDLQLPANPFFKPGREFDCRLRHASVSFMDDASLVVRGASLKFADEDINSPLDLLMNNGAGSPFWNAWTFAQFMWTKVRGGRLKMVAYFRRNPRCFVNVVEALRLNPDSFSQLYYHSETPFQFVSEGGEDRLIKFRLIPEDRGPESGLPTANDLETPWFQDPAKHEARSPNYLKDEFESRLKQTGSTVSYHLQAQVRDWEKHDRRDMVLSSLYPWDEQDWPWVDVATVTVGEALSREAGDQCLFSIRHLPDCIKCIPPQSIFDPPSLEYLRVAGYWPRRARLLGYRLLGRTKPTPEQRKPETHADQEMSKLCMDDVYMSASLPQNDAPGRQQTRKQKLEAECSQYQYFQPLDASGAPLGPPQLKNLPEIEATRFEKVKIRLIRLGLYIRFHIIGARIETVIRGFSGVEAYKTLCPLRNRPAVIDYWTSDIDFARQRLAGVHPGLISRCDTLPEKFPVTDAIVAGILDPRDTLQAAASSGRLYVCDYHLLDGMKGTHGSYLTAPLALFYVGADEILKPIAVQLGQSPEAGPIFTPKDDFWLWQLVKAFVQCADAQQHEALAHLFETHFTSEICCIAMHRQLSVGHPVHQLLKPHLDGTLAINDGARRTLLKAGNELDQAMAAGCAGAVDLVNRVWEEWSFEASSLEADLIARGVDDPDSLPGYHFRDDGRRVWAAIQRFVNEVIRHFYQSEQDLKEDYELAAWIGELTAENGGGMPHVPGLDSEGRLCSIKALVHLLTQIIFTASAGHSAVNNGQYGAYGFIPSTPGSLYLPPPKDKQPLTEAVYLKALPSFAQASLQVRMVYILSIRTRNPLGKYTPAFFAGTSEIGSMIERFTHELKQIEQEIERRNIGVDVPYTYLHPAQISQSVRT